MTTSLGTPSSTTLRWLAMAPDPARSENTAETVAPPFTLTVSL